MFYVCLIFFVLLYAFVLEIAKNTLAGWAVLLIAAACFAFVRIRMRAGNAWNGRSALLCWVIFAAVLLLNLKLTEPPIRRVPVWNGRVDATEVLHIAQGDLTGVYSKDHSTRTYAGIPYAKPPVGNLRWREPQDPEGWTGVLTCDTFGPMAVQPQDNVMYATLSRILGFHDFRPSIYDNYREPVSEDCLYLNVYCPGEVPAEPLPVLFYVHGGSLTSGQPWYVEYRGEDMAKQGLVVVNFAYRVGPLGYYADEALAAESPNGTTGNYGLLDQIKALEWVRKNIASFGGDPDRITIIGESAGASSVNALCTSPLTEGMFLRAIAHSSGIVSQKPYHTFRSMEKALEEGAKLRQELGAADLASLRALPAEKLLETSAQNGAMTVDGYALTEDPRQTYLKGENHEQALLNGFNVKEADAFLLGTKATAENYESLLEPIFGSYAAEAAALVPPGSVTRDQKFIIDAGGEAKGALNELYTAAWFTYSHYVWSDLVLQEGRQVYEYYFTKTNKCLSNFHAGELPYVFGNLWRHPGVYDDADEALSETMLRMWANFAKTGDPNGEGLPRWEPLTPESRLLLRFDDTCEMVEDPNLEIYELLDRYQEEAPSEP
ncbi:MAG: carboxylesterase family protein [Lachnospiraceae bacterium]|nr:carboxylesterase family protein [Lachnospiraceae bacterium]